MQISQKKIVKNFYYAVLSNLISLFISSIVVFLIPKIIGVKEYGYWQIYLFYVSYVGFLHFGWNDGIYLRFGGKSFDDLIENQITKYLNVLLCSQILIACFIYFYSCYFLNDLSKSLILKLLAICVVLTNVRGFFLYILQTTNHIVEYSKITILDRLVYIVLILLLIVSNVYNYKLMIVADLVARFISLLWSLWLCREILNYKFFFRWPALSIENIKINFNAGFRLMVANIASMLIVGSIRFGIEKQWDVETFGKVSLTLSLSNLLMTFINSVGMILFPLLKQYNNENLKNIYTQIRTCLMVIVLFFIGFYPFIKAILLFWLPQYEISIKYMIILLPICVFEGKMALLINTYFKALRYEKQLLYINLFSLLVSIILTIISTLVFNNLTLTIVTIIIVLALRSYIAEMYLQKKLKIILLKDIFIEVVLILIFVLLNWNLNSNFAFIYFAFYIIYIGLTIDRITNAMQFIVKKYFDKTRIK